MASRDRCVAEYQKCVREHPGPLGQQLCLAQLMRCVANRMHSFAADQFDQSEEACAEEAAQSMKAGLGKKD
jgi:hypothetical protein